MSYIYPSWIRAKIELAKNLRLNAEQKAVLHSWFSNHVFEFGASHNVHERSVEEREYLIHVKKSNVMRIAENIHDTGLIMERTIDFSGYKTYETRILICGVPSVVGPERRIG